ncbi:hypothetical protein ACIQXM_02615 [Arthrobacter sp. NPDC097144]|uniref:hypothetical protein n=1 Tax=Arthrobacter sp. NPDC097144 TaxID=3363946 RepID=UPI00382BDAAE
MSRTDAAAAMLLSALAAAVTTALAVHRISSYLSGPVTLTLPLSSPQISPTGLAPGTQAYYSSVEATVPSVPQPEAALLAWGDALSQTGTLAALALIFLLASRLRRDVLFTAGSALVIGTCGTVLALAGSAGQVLDTMACTRLAEDIGANGNADTEYPLFVGTFSMAPLVAGLALILVAGVFEYGRRLQKDAEGLV